MNQDALSIIKTLTYSDVFNFPLTKQEIYHRLITSKKLTLPRFNLCLSELTHNGSIKKSGSYFHLPGRHSVVKKRLDALFYSQQKQIKAKQVAAKIIKLPFIKAVFLTGAVAVKNATAEDDIDLLIITEPNRLWISRFLVTLWLELHWLRRRPGMKKVANKICANLYLTQDNLTVPIDYQNLYTAYEVCQVVPLADPNKLHLKFMYDNAWICSYLKNHPFPECLKIISPLISTLWIPNWLESLMYKLQSIYMQPRRTRERIESNLAYFHPRDLAKEVLTLYNKRLESYLK